MKKQLLVLLLGSLVSTTAFGLNWYECTDTLQKIKEENKRSIAHSTEDDNQLFIILLQNATNKKLADITPTDLDGNKLAHKALMNKYIQDEMKNQYKDLFCNTDSETGRFQNQCQEIQRIIELLNTDLKKGIAKTAKLRMNIIEKQTIFNPFLISR